MVLGPEELYSREKMLELNRFFQDKKRGKLAKILSICTYFGEGETTYVGDKHVRENVSDQSSDFLSDRSSSACGSTSPDRMLHCPLTTGVVSPKLVPNLPLMGVGAENYSVSSIGTLNLNKCTDRQERTDQFALARVTATKNVDIRNFPSVFVSVPSVDDVTSSKGKGGRLTSRKRRMEKRRVTRMLNDVKSSRKECESCECTGWGDCGEVSLHCTCFCMTLDVAGVKSDDVILLLTTEEQEAGVVELEVSDGYSDVELPTLSDAELEMVKKGQEGIQSLKLKAWLNGGVPGKQEALGLRCGGMVVIRAYFII